MVIHFFFQLKFAHHGVVYSQREREHGRLIQSLKMKYQTA